MPNKEDIIAGLQNDSLIFQIQIMNIEAQPVLFEKQNRVEQRLLQT